MRNRVIITSALGSLMLLASGCTERQFQPGFDDDGIGPSVSIVKSSGDTLNISAGLRFGVAAADNLGLKSLTIAFSGGYNAAMDTVFTSAVTTAAFDVTVSLAGNTTAGGWVYITATAVDGNNNSASAVDSVYLLNQDALTVSIVRPSAGALTSPSRQIVVELLAQHSAGVQVVGYRATGVVTDSSSRGYSSPLPQTATFVDTLTIPASANIGTFTITGFVRDSTGRSATSAAVVVTVQSVSNDTDPPVVSFVINSRVEVDDSITVKATDPGGIQQLGWYALLRDDTTQQVGGASASVGGGTLTDVSHTWPLNFNFTSTNLPRYVLIRAWAEDANGNRDTTANASSSSGSPPAAQGAAAAASSSDTILVVHGTTTPLPAGGRVIDGIYNRNLNEVYLTNVDLGRIEVFQVADTSFVASGIPVGSRPWGIALWPRNVTTGANADTVVIANSGGTDLSIVDLQSRREVRRHSLPNFLVDEVTTEADDATGTIQLRFTRHDFSDRPQYLGMTCRPGVGACNAGGIIAVYSTTPTIDQDDLPLRGSLRWENLTSATPSSHFFWEHAEVLPAPDFDTVQVLVDRGPNLPLDTVLSAACGRMADMDKVVFEDRTFVRNSGDFSHALAGEGGVQTGDFAQAVGFNVARGIQTRNCTGFVTVGAGVVQFTGPEEVDLGISPSFRVSDFISNTATVVTSIALNFNGLTNLVRTTDSVYVLNEALRLKGLISAPGTNAGMDLNFDHNFEAGIGGTAGTSGGTGDPDDRLVFLASSAAEIRVFDTFFFGRVTTLPIRDPIIGPLRVAKLASGQQILVGVTAYGVVTLQLPGITNIFPAEGWSGSEP